MRAQAARTAATPRSPFNDANGFPARIPAAAPVEGANVGLGAVVEVGAGAKTGCALVVDVDVDVDVDVGVEVGT